jgi:hypothetical protein
MEKNGVINYILSDEDMSSLQDRRNLIEDLQNSPYRRSWFMFNCADTKCAKQIVFLDTVNEDIYRRPSVNSGNITIFCSDCKYDHIITRSGKKLTKKTKSTFSEMTRTVSIDAILVVWLTAFQEMGDESQVELNPNGQDTYFLERDIGSHDVYLVYTTDKILSKWVKVTEEDFRNADKSPTDYAAPFVMYVAKKLSS